MSNSVFNLEGRVLSINADSTELEVYRWNAPEKIPVFFIFADDNVHIITLDEHEKPFTSVRTNTQEKKVKLITDEEVIMYANEAELRNQNKG